MLDRKVLALTAGILTSGGGVVGCAPPRGAVPLNTTQERIVDAELARGKVFLPTVVSMAKASSIRFDLKGKDADNADSLALGIQEDYGDVVWLREEGHIMAIDPSYRKDPSDPELAFYDGAQRLGAHERIKHDYVVIYTDSFEYLDMFQIAHEMGHSHGGHEDGFVEKRDNEADDLAMLKVSRAERDPASISGILWDETLGVFDNAMTALSPRYNALLYTAQTEEEYRDDAERSIEQMMDMDPETFWDTALVPIGSQEYSSDIEKSYSAVDFVGDPIYKNLGWKRSEAIKVFSANPVLQAEAAKHMRYTVEKQIEIRLMQDGDWETGIVEPTDERRRQSTRLR